MTVVPSLLAHGSGLHASLPSLYMALDINKNAFALEKQTIIYILTGIHKGFCQFLKQRLHLTHGIYLREPLHEIQKYAKNISPENL